MERPVISVFGSRAPLPGSPDYLIAREVGTLLAQAGFAVATGGYGGVMAAVSQGAAEYGGYVIGVTSNQVEKSRPSTLNEWVMTEIRYDTLGERVMHLVTQNQGMIVLSGGIGTLSELALAWSLLQVKEIGARPLVLMGELWPEILKVFARPEYVSAEHLALIHCTMRPTDAVAYIAQHT